MYFLSKLEIVPKVKTPTGKTRVKIRIENDSQGFEITHDLEIQETMKNVLSPKGK